MWGLCIVAGNIRRFREKNFLTKLNFWLNFSQNHKCGTRNIHDVKINDKQKSDDRRANERRRTFDEKTFLTNCPAVAFDEIFRCQTKISCYSVTGVKSAAKATASLCKSFLVKKKKIGIFSNAAGPKARLVYSTVGCRRTVCRRTARLEFHLKIRTTQAGKMS